MTVTIIGNGIGGRNQEMLLAYLDIIKKESLNHQFLIIAANLDGIEGNSRAMGALIDNPVLNETISKRLPRNIYKTTIQTVFSSRLEPKLSRGLPDVM